MSKVDDKLADHAERRLHSLAFDRRLREIQRYGLPGSDIPGTRLMRDYCIDCGQAIRVKHVGQHRCEIIFHADFRPECRGNAHASLRIDRVSVPAAKHRLYFAESRDSRSDRR